MYCPNCGSQNNKKQNFCRYCGLQLKDIERAYANQLVFGVESDRLKRLRKISRATTALQFFASVIFFIGMIGLRVFENDAGRFLITAGIVLFVFAQAVQWINGYFQRQNSKQNVIEQKSDTVEVSEDRARTTNKLLQDTPFTPAQSVVEHTTRQLQTEDRARK